MQNISDASAENYMWTENREKKMPKHLDIENDDLYRFADDRRTELKLLEKYFLYSKEFVTMLTYF